MRTIDQRPHTRAVDGPLMRAIGRFAESEDPVLFATYDEVDKCKFIKVNAPEEAWEAWSSTDDGEGLLVKAGALRKQAREMLVSAARSRISAAHLLQLSPSLRATGSNHCRRKSPRHRFWQPPSLRCRREPPGPAALKRVATSWPPARPPQGQGVQPAATKKLAAKELPAAEKESPVKIEMAQASCRYRPSPPPLA